MKYKIGLDFGTTTSILSYMENGKLQRFFYGGESDDGTPYIPTAVLYEENDIYIGQFALDRVGEGFFPERYFKMRLPLSNNETGNNAPETLTVNFIGELLTGNSSYRRQVVTEKNNKLAFTNFKRGEIESVVVSVPQTWIENNPSSVLTKFRRTLREALGIPSVRFIGEPIAAAAYFSYCYGSAFRGNLLVCDMGGGTFDVTLCRIAENQIDVIAKAGSETKDERGIAGMYFDSTLIANTFGSLNPSAFAALMNNLDETKKKQRKAENLKEILQNKRNANTPIYTLGSNEQKNIRIDDIKKAFAKVESGIEETLKEVILQADKIGERINKVVMVGGFAKFPLVQQTIGFFFKEDVFDAPKLIDLKTFNTDEIAFAISYGACLIANDLIDISKKYQNTVGLVVTDASGCDLEFELIKAGSSMANLMEVSYIEDQMGHKQRFLVGQNSTSLKIEIFVRPAENINENYKVIHQFPLPKGSDARNNRYYFIGKYVDKNYAPYLVIEDEQNGMRIEQSLASVISSAVRTLGTGRV